MNNSRNQSIDSAKALAGQAAIASGSGRGNAGHSGQGRRSGEERFEYALVAFPQQIYGPDAAESLAALFSYAVDICNIDGDDFASAFVASGLAEEFERCNPVFISGMSAQDLLVRLADFLPQANPAREGCTIAPTKHYWLGLSLAMFQTTTGISYRTVFDALSYDELIDLYHPLHEAPIEKFISVVEGLLADRQMPTALQRIRRANGLSQAQLAREANVSLRSIQMYEQRHKDINAAQARTLYRLSLALHCSMESLLER